MADAAVSNTAEGNLVWVRLPPSVPPRSTPGERTLPASAPPSSHPDGVPSWSRATPIGCVIAAGAPRRRDAQRSRRSSRRRYRLGTDRDAARPWPRLGAACGRHSVRRRRRGDLHAMRPGPTRAGDPRQPGRARSRRGVSRTPRRPSTPPTIAEDARGPGRRRDRDDLGRRRPVHARGAGTTAAAPPRPPDADRAPDPRGTDRGGRRHGRLQQGGPAHPRRHARPRRWP